MFMLAKGEVELNMKDQAGALATLEAAYEIPGVKDASAPLNKMMKENKSFILKFTDKERCSLFLMLAKA